MLPLVRLLALAAWAASAFACAPTPLDYEGPTAEWPEYGGDKGGLRWSPLTQITPQNVDDLEVAWIHRSGDWHDLSGGLAPTSFQVTPIVVDGTLYYCTPRNRVFALDPETGEERWVYDPVVDISHLYITNCRGVSHWVDPTAAEAAACASRIVTGTLDARLIALDAKTGRPCAGFGANGTVDLSHGIGDIAPGEYGVTSAPVIVGGRIVTGTMVLDNRRVDAPGGVVRAYDARTGALAWAWDPVLPIDARAEGSEILYRRGTTNAWSTLSADPELGLVYVPTGNTSPDHFGGHRKGLDHYSSSVVALEIATGEVRWHYQTVHHDIWDYDLPSQPTLFDFPTEDGGTIPALVQPTKMGFLFVLDRQSGRPLFEVEERPVPQEGHAPDEYLSETQPFPTKPPSLHKESLSPDDAFGFALFDEIACRRTVESLLHGPIYTPPSLQGTVMFPGMLGGMNWGSAAVDPESAFLVVNVHSIMTMVRLMPRDVLKEKYGDKIPEYGVEPQEGTPYAIERVPIYSPFGAPCNEPPWGELVGVDLAKGEIAWRTTLGTSRDMAPWPAWFQTGTPSLGGPLVTASGLVFIGATTDFFLRAFDQATGENLWERRLPTAAHATPMTYRLREDGRQFVVIAAGGHGILGTPPGDALMAFALPE